MQGDMQGEELPGVTVAEAEEEAIAQEAPAEATAIPPKDPEQPHIHFDRRPTSLVAFSDL